MGAKDNRNVYCFDIGIQKFSERELYLCYKLHQVLSQNIVHVCNTYILDEKLKKDNNLIIVMYY